MADQVVLGIETSCDETAAAVLSSRGRIASNIVASQAKWHEFFRGVVPEIASRKHLELINSVVDQALAEAGVGFDGIDLIAVTIGPGLVGALLVGVAAAKAFAYAGSIPLIGVNHIEGHIYAAMLDHPKLKPPFIALVASGGHTSLFYVRNHGDYETLGETRDDAAGEAFDKIASFLGLGYPGGPAIDKLAVSGNPNAVDFPRAMLGEDSFDFSFSGLKTSVIYHVSRSARRGEKDDPADLAASFQAAIVDVLVGKSLLAARAWGVKRVVVAGGVAANSELRRCFREAVKDEKIDLYIPRAELSTDNAAMIAWAGYNRFIRGERSDLDATPNPSLELS